MATTKITEQNISNLANLGVQWQAVKTSNFTAVAGQGYFVNTTSATVSITLPSSPSAGDTFIVRDYAGTFATYNCIILIGSATIEGTTGFNWIINTNGQTTAFTYSDATKGWLVEFSGKSSEAQQQAFYVAATGGTVLTNGSYKTHVFTGCSTFVVSCAGNSIGSNSVEYLVVAGGGSPGKCYGGGGGAGGYRQIFPSPSTGGLPVSATTYPVTVGAGGAAPSTPARPGTKGSDSIFSTITSTGGGFGATWNYSPGFNSNGGPGGSGGGGGGSGINQTPGTGGAGNTPPVSPPQGNPGGQGAGPGQYGSAGGGGASTAGAQGSSAGGCNGGAGSSILSTIFGPTAPSYGTTGPSPTGRYFAGGGSGYANPSGTGGGVGGGGNVGISGTTNTGGGGGAEAGSGGKGIVVIRYQYQA